jgi:hypothetical protein
LGCSAFLRDEDTAPKQNQQYAADLAAQLRVEDAAAILRARISYTDIAISGCGAAERRVGQLDLVKYGCYVLTTGVRTRITSVATLKWAIG